MVTVFLVGIAITVLVAALVPSLRVTLRGHQRIELQQSGRLALRFMQDDLGLSARAGVAQGPNWLSAHRLREVSAAGTQVWEDHVVVYRWTDENLTRSIWRPADLDLGRPYQPSGVSADDLTETRVVARGVEAFKVTPGTPTHIELTVHRGDNRLTLDRWLYLRNSAR